MPTRSRVRVRVRGTCLHGDGARRRRNGKEDEDETEKRRETKDPKIRSEWDEEGGEIREEEISTSGVGSGSLGGGRR